MTKKTLKSEDIRKFISEVNEKGNTIANFMEIAKKYDLDISDLGSVTKVVEKEYFWNIDGVGKLIEKDGVLDLIE